MIIVNKTLYVTSALLYLLILMHYFGTCKITIILYNLNIKKFDSNDLICLIRR